MSDFSYRLEWRLQGFQLSNVQISEHSPFHGADTLNTKLAHVLDPRKKKKSTITKKIPQGIFQYGINWFKKVTRIKLRILRHLVIRKTFPSQPRKFVIIFAMLNHQRSQSWPKTKFGLRYWCWWRTAVWPEQWTSTIDRTHVKRSHDAHRGTERSSFFSGQSDHANSSWVLSWSDTEVHPIWHHLFLAWKTQNQWWLRVSREHRRQNRLLNW